MVNHSVWSKFAVPGVKALKSYLIKKAEKTCNFGENFIFSENANVLRHNFCHRASILIWKVALESFYQQLSNA